MSSIIEQLVSHGFWAISELSGKGSCVAYFWNDYIYERYSITEMPCGSRTGLLSFSWYCSLFKEYFRAKKWFGLGVSKWKKIMTRIFLWLISNSAQVKDRLNLSGASLCYKLVPYTLARTMLCVSQKLRISRQIILDRRQICLLGRNQILG